VTQIVEHPEVLLYTRIRKSPFFYASRRHGVKMYSFYNHMYHPRHYGDPVGEYWQLLNGVTLWDVGVERQVEITGPDAFTLANMLVPRDLNKCAVGQCKYVFITAPDGGIINDPILLRLDENHFWISVADSDVLLWAMGVACNSGLDVTIDEPDIGPLQIQGPKSKEVVVADMCLDTNPYEVEMGYEWMADLEQEADFVGKEALRRIKEQGVSRKLIGIEIGGQRLGSYNDGSMIDVYPVLANGGQIGKVTSACYSPRLEKNIGYAMVPIEYTQLGTKLEVETPRERTTAVVVPRPFIDPDKEIPKQDLASAAARDDSSS